MPKTKAAASKVPARVYSPTVRDRHNRTLTRAVRPSDVEFILEAALVQGDWRAQAELFDQMEDTWPRLNKALNEIKRAVSKLPFEIEAFAAKGEQPTPSAEEKARFVESVLWKFRPKATRFERDFEGMIYDLLDAYAKGISVVEIIWEATPEGIVPRAAQQLPAAYIAFPNLGGPNTGDGVMFDPAARYGSPAVVEFPEDNFLVGIHRSRSGNPCATAALRSLAKYWVASQYGYQWLTNYAQVFGTPMRWATYDPNNKALLDDISAMLENIGSAGWGAFPIGTTLEIKEPSGKAGENPQRLLMEIADKACDLLILGQTLTSDVGDSGSRALGDVHSKVRSDVFEGAADWVCGIINSQLIPALLRLNYGDDTEAPRIGFSLKVAEDAKANAERDEILIGKMGLPVEKTWLYARHGIPMPAPDASDDSLFVVKPAQPLAIAPAPATTARAAAPEHAALVQARESIARDKLADEVMSRLSGVAADWLRPARPFFADLISKAQDKTVTDADFLRAIEKAASTMPELFDKLDTASLSRAMEEAMGAAAVNGAYQSAARGA